MIYFIGAGPGAVDLITVRGATLLEKADLVIYAGSLVNPQLLDRCQPSAVIRNSAVMTLEQVIAAMASMPREAIIVRLHTGDPALFGAIREQMDALDALELPYEVVPGVSSFCAAAAAIPAEYTLPDVSQTVIISRCEGRTPVPKRERLRELAAHQATMVLFLSVGMLEKVCAELMGGGYPSDTPAAVVFKASWSEQEIVRGTLSDLPTKAGHIGKTALILVGRFLGNEYERSRLYDPSFTTEFREATK